MKGFINFYINYVPGLEIDQDVEKTINILRTQNKELFERLVQLGYEVCFIPCVRESTRVEKVDLNKPFPRFNILEKAPVALDVEELMQDMEEK